MKLQIAPFFPFAISIIFLNIISAMQLADPLRTNFRAPKQLSGTPEKETNSEALDTLLKTLKGSSAVQGKQASRIRQGIYIPDARFNAFVDGVMVNMVTEMKRLGMDPLYFRVHGEGVVEHVITRLGRKTHFLEGNNELRQPRQDVTTSSSTIAGGLIRGLKNITRFGNAEVQVAGNATLVRSHWLMGPLAIVIDFRDDPGIRRARTNIPAVQFDTLTVIDRLGAEMEDCELIRPLFGYLAYYGNRTLIQQTTTQLVIQHIFTEGSFMTNLLKKAFRRASYDKIIPQYGADDGYYSMLKYLFARG